MFVAMSPIDILVVPSAFTKVTGQAHWHALLKARSIEMQCYVVAANQVGKHPDSRETFGHSCIYSPWGELLSLVDTNEGFASAVFDPKQITDIRRNMPVLSHTQERYEFE
jgi:predicted amidohydrolase